MSVTELYKSTYMYMFVCVLFIALTHFSLPARVCTPVTQDLQVPGFFRSSCWEPVVLFPERAQKGLFCLSSRSPELQTERVSCSSSSSPLTHPSNLPQLRPPSPTPSPHLFTLHPSAPAPLHPSTPAPLHQCHSLESLAQLPQ